MPDRETYNVTALTREFAPGIFVPNLLVTEPDAHAHAHKSLLSLIKSLNQIAQQITVRLARTRQTLLLLSGPGRELAWTRNASKHESVSTTSTLALLISRWTTSLTGRIPFRARWSLKLPVWIVTRLYDCKFSSLISRQFFFFPLQSTVFCKETPYLTRTLIIFSKSTASQVGQFCKNCYEENRTLVGRNISNYEGYNIL